MVFAMTVFNIYKDSGMGWRKKIWFKRVVVLGAPPHTRNRSLRVFEIPFDIRANGVPTHRFKAT